MGLSTGLQPKTHSYKHRGMVESKTLEKTLNWPSINPGLKPIPTSVERAETSGEGTLQTRNN